MGVWNWLLSPQGLTPHGFCLTWAPGLLWLHAGADAVIGLSYFSIPVALVWLGRLRRDIQQIWIVYLFGAFILACGTTHFMSILTLWVPAYGVEGLIKLVTAGLSVATAVVLWPLIPKVAALPSGVELARMNASLAAKVAEQEETARLLRESEAETRIAKAHLEDRVAERTAALTAAIAARDEALRSLEASEAEYRSSFEAAAVGKVLADPVSATVQRVNPAFAHMLGYEPEELAGVNAWDLSFPEDDAGAREAWGRLMSGEDRAYIREKPYRHRDGSPVWARISATVVRDPAGQPLRTYAVIENIDERRRAEVALREYETRLRLAVESAQIGVWEVDFANNQGRLDERGSAMTAHLLPAEVWLDLDDPRFGAWVAGIHPDDRPGRDVAVKAVREGATEVVHMDYRVRRHDGSWIWLSHWRAVVARDPLTGAPTRSIGIMMDTTDRALAEVELRATLAQRDLLLREVYHRVKNNLQIVDGLVMMQARQLKDPVAAEALSGLRSRVYALGLVHHQLMASANLETFDIAPFLSELVSNILDGGGHHQVVLDLDVSPLHVDLDFAIPLGLLVTELVTNALKHALRDGVGRIKVGFKPEPNGRIMLSVADDGPGYVDDGSVKAGLGAIIIAGLVGQLDGVMTTRNAPGLVTEISIATPERT
ncbi:sensor histidine kinase [Phenylobacterium aquaticum]|uniref:sensor histidine kinase n=1 Tax=Phenylobacterium aquaticum TaxID=1763816 RepID=UPI0026EFBE48|nr:PAS domain S-box protein [Phenylobacterium aquaticum]